MRSQDFYRELVDRLSCGVCLVGPDGHVEVWNDWMAEHSGLPASNAHGESIWTLFPRLEEGRGGLAVRAALEKGRGGILSAALHQHPLLTNADAPPHSVAVHSLDGARRRALLVVRDLTTEAELTARLDAATAENAAQREALRSAKDRFAHMTHFDPVTGLANRHRVRTFLEGSVAKSLAEDRLGALLLLDLDRFAEVNGSVGPAVADQVLRLVGARLADAIRPQRYRCPAGR